MRARWGLLALVLVASACGDSGADGPTDLDRIARDFPSETTTTTQPATPSTTTLPPEPTTTTEPAVTVRELTVPVGSYSITGVAEGRVLHVRGGPGSGFDIVDEFLHNGVGIRTTGRGTETSDGAVWLEVARFDTNETGWVKGQYLQPEDGPCSNEDGALGGIGLIVTSPIPGDRVSGGFTVTGCSRSTVFWSLLHPSGAEIANGRADGGSEEGPASFAAEVVFAVAEFQAATLVVAPRASTGQSPTRIPVFLSPGSDGTTISRDDPCFNDDRALDGAAGVLLTGPRSGERVDPAFELSGCAASQGGVFWLLTDQAGEQLAVGSVSAVGGGWEEFLGATGYSVDVAQLGTLTVFGDDGLDTEIPVVLSP